MFESLKSHLDKLASIDEDTIWFNVIDRETQFEIIRLNTEDQLFDEGIRSDGSSLPDYSRRSVEEFGKPNGHIRLRDTGAFYQSFRVKVDKWGLFIAADDVKEDTVLTEAYGIDILGLTEENTNILIKMIKRKYLEELHGKLSS